MSITNEELDVRFESHGFDGPARQLLDAVEPQFKQIACTLDDNIGDCRELSLALTKLEEAYHWACVATRNIPATQADINVAQHKVPAMSQEDLVKLKQCISKIEGIIDGLIDSNHNQIAISLGATKNDIAEIIRRVEKCDANG